MLNSGGIVFQEAFSFLLFVYDLIFEAFFKKISIE